jgi:magnesium chelatase family protein
MLFKTISASVYGIDAYLVEVEVDVGSARMQDFNVVGLPDNAVKESRERIKSALRNCGFEFPYGQGVTINLAPADVRKEGSGFDLPMALGLAGCMGQFFGKPLDQCMFLGELSLDGGVRPVRGALSAALAARDKGLKAIAVPEANAREAAVVEGVNVFGLKSLPQAVDLVNSPESFTPVKVDAGQMLTEAAQYNVDLRDVGGQQAAPARARGFLRRRPQHFIHRPTRRRKNHVGQNGFPPYCRQCPSKKPSKPPASTASPERWMTTAAWSAPGRIVRRTTPSATQA